MSYSFYTNFRFLQPDLAELEGKKIQTVTKIAGQHTLLLN